MSGALKGGEASSTRGGRIRVQILRFLIVFPGPLLFLLATGAITALCVYLGRAGLHPHGWYDSLIVGSGVAAVVYAVWEVLDTFSTGTVVPGRIVSLWPLRIAALVDLRKTTEGRDYFALRVVQGSRVALAGDLRVGDEVLMWAWDGDRGGPRFAHRVGVRVECVEIATGDPAVLVDAARRIEPRQWPLLDAAIAQLPRTTWRRTYRVDLSRTTGAASGWPPESIGKPLGWGGWVRA